MQLALHPADAERLAVARARLMGQGFAQVGEAVLVPSTLSPFFIAWFPVRIKAGDQARFVTPDDAGYRELNNERFIGPIIPEMMLPHP